MIMMLQEPMITEMTKDLIQTEKMQRFPSACSRGAMQIPAEVLRRLQLKVFGVWRFPTLLLLPNDDTGGDASTRQATSHTIVQTPNSQ